MKYKDKGFTLVELLTVVAIIAMLVGLLVPSLNMVRRMAKNTKQKAQFATIDMALTAFKGDWGDYPPSFDRDGRAAFTCGAQQLAEALLGQDMLGFHRDSEFFVNGRSMDNFTNFYPSFSNPLTPAESANLDARIGPYLEVATASVFTLDDLFGAGNTGQLTKDLPVICDVFGVRKITLASGETIMAGTPILYYKADPTKKSFVADPLPGNQIYNSRHNQILISLGVLPELNPLKPHPLQVNPGYFYNSNYKIRNPKIQNIAWPYRPDSYILISAGADGLYGTRDDICNF